MREIGIRPYEEFAAHIQHETAKARKVARAKVADRRVESAGCVDGLTKKGSWNPPGGAIFLMNEGHLDDFLAKRRKGKLFVHLKCGYMRVVMRLDTVEAQRGVIERLQQRITQYNSAHRANFTVIVEQVGSAAPYMKK